VREESEYGPFIADMGNVEEAGDDSDTLEKADICGNEELGELVKARANEDENKVGNIAFHDRQSLTTCSQRLQK
jgi:hypothetical protein